MLRSLVKDLNLLVGNRKGKYGVEILQG